MNEKRIDFWNGTKYLGELRLTGIPNPPRVSINTYYTALAELLPKNFKNVHPTMDAAIEYVVGLFPGWVVENLSDDCSLIRKSPIQPMGASSYGMPSGRVARL